MCKIIYHSVLMLTVLILITGGLHAEIVKDSPEERALSEYMEPESEHEYRGIWITRFEWPSEDPEECRDKIREIFNEMQKANFNLALFQVRGACETLYPSEIEPWSPLIGGKDPGFDPLALAILEAHRRDIELHAYINPMPLVSARRGIPPKDMEPLHLFHRHGPESEKPWICVNEKGEPMDPGRAGYWYLSPGIPEVHAYLREVIRDLVTRYDIDGIHFDRIRYPGPQYSHDPVSEARFHGLGNPELMEWGDWQREQITKLINDAYAEIRSIKPECVVSCAAWGIYNRYHIKGYYGFSSGYHDYYQDTWNWIRIGGMDLLVPMIYWDLEDPKPNYDELVDDFAGGIGANRFLGGQRMYGREWLVDENINQILYGRKAGLPGSVVFAYGSSKGKGAFERFPATVYKEKISPPRLSDYYPQKGGIILGTVIDEENHPVKDAWVSLDTDDRRASRSSLFRRTWTSSSDGRFAFLEVPDMPVTINVEYPGASKATLQNIQVAPGELKGVEITLKDMPDVEKTLFLDIMRPDDQMETTDNVVHILGRTSPGAEATVDGEKVEVYSTGAFARDNIPLEMGENKIEISARNEEGRSARMALTVIRKKPEPPREISEISILEPSADAAFMPGDIIEIKARGPVGKKLKVSLFNGHRELSMSESLNEDQASTGVYTTIWRIPPDFHSVAMPFTVQLVPEKPGEGEGLEKKSESQIEVWNPSAVKVARTLDDKTAISFGTHYVRLGGPYLAEVESGTRFQVVGNLGDRYRIKLSESLSGWVDADNVEMLPENTPVPQAMFTYCIINGDKEKDYVWFPLKEKVVVSVTPVRDSDQYYLEVDFFDTHYATTWFSHKSGAKIIGNVTGTQVEDGLYRLRVPVKSKTIWGWWLDRDEGGNLRLNIRRPPEIASPPASPLKGIRFALEAGHGGRGSGAVGFMGTREKTINYMAVKAIRKVLEERGAEVVEVRPGDTQPTLGARTDMAFEEGCDFYLSIHANAAGTSRGFLRVSGTSTYYRYIHCAPVAQYVYDELLALDWEEFGVVGNFHYYPLRDPRMPSMLVEQAFMSHPGDEARLLDLEYQADQAEAIVKGLENFFDSVREEE